MDNTPHIYGAQQGSSAREAGPRPSALPLAKGEGRRRPLQETTTLSVQLSHPEDLYIFPEEAEGHQGPLILDVKCGTVRLEPKRSLTHTTVNLYGPNARLVVTDSNNLDKTVFIRSLEDASVLQFDSPEPVRLEASVLARQRLCVRVSQGEVVWTGECSGQADIQKEGPGGLSFQGQESQPHTWCGLEGTLTGAFRHESRVKLQQEARYLVTKDQTLASFSGSSETSLQLEKACLTVSQEGQFSGRLSADELSRIHIKKAFSVEAQGASSWPLTVDGTLTLKGTTPILRELSGHGVIQTDVPVHLVNGEGKASTFEGTWKGEGGFVKKGLGHLRLTGSSPDFQAECEINEGTLELSPEAALGSGRWVLTGGTLCPTSATNVQGELLVKGGALRTRGSLTLSSPLQLEDALFIVEDGSLTLTSLLSMNKQSHVTKRGPGTLTLTGPLKAQGGFWSIQEGTLEDAHSASNMTLPPFVDVGAKGAYLPRQPQTLSGLSGLGTVWVDHQLTLMCESPQTFQGTLGGQGMLSLVAGEFRATSESFSEAFKGSLHLAAGTSLTSPSVWHLQSLAGEGVFSTQGAPLTLHIGKNSTFAGQLKEVGLVSLTSENDSTLTLEAPQEGVNWALERDVHVKAQGALLGGSILCNGGYMELNEVSDLDVLQGNSGCITVAQELLWRSSGDTGFGGDFRGSGTLTTAGDVAWNLEGQSLFEGNLHLQKGVLALGASTLLPSQMCVDISPQAQLRLSSSQSFSELTGGGNIQLGSYTLQLSPRQSSSFSGDFIASPAGQLDIDSTEPWTWSGGRKLFAGTLCAHEKTNLSLDGLEETNFDLDLAERSQVEFLTETTLRGGLKTQGTAETLPVLKASVPLALSSQEPLTFRGHISTDAPFYVKGTFIWQEGSFTPATLCLLEGATCHVQQKETLPSEASVYLNKDSLLTLPDDQTLKSLQGTGTLTLQGHALTLTPRGNIFFGGCLKEASELSLQGTGNGDCFWAHTFEDVKKIVLNDATLVWTRNHEKPLESLTLKTTQSRFSLEADFGCQTLEGTGAITCGEHRFTIQGGRSSFSGPILEGTLNLTEKAQMVWCTQPQTASPLPRLTPIRWKGPYDSTQEEEDVSKSSSVALEKGTQLTLQGPTLLTDLRGEGSVHFEALSLHPAQSFTLEASLEGQVLRLGKPCCPEVVISLAETLQSSTQEVICQETCLDIQKGCRWASPVWTFVRSHLTLHGNPSEAQTRWVFAGENTLQSEALTLTQEILLSPQSHLTLQHDGDVTLKGRIQGSSRFCKEGKGPLYLAGQLDLTGLLDVQEGQVVISEIATQTRRFGLHISELASVVLHRDLDIRSLQGKGTLSLPQGHKVTVHLEGNENIETPIQGGSLVLTSRAPTEVSLSEQKALQSLTVAEKVTARISEPSSLERSTLHIEGTLLALSETLKQLDLSGHMTCSEVLFLGEKDRESTLSGYLMTPTFVVQGGVVHLLAALEAQTVAIREGLLMSADALSRVQDIQLEASGTLCGRGTLRHLVWKGCLRPESGPKKGISSDFLSVQQAEIQEGARLDMNLYEGTCQPLVIQEKSSSLDGLRLKIRGRESDVQRLTQTSCLLMTVPGNVKGVPLLDEKEGIATLFKRPSEILTVARIRNNVALFAQPFTKEDLR